MTFKPAQSNDYESGFDEIMCTARACPNVWTVHMGSKLCSVHAWSDPKDWPSLTDKLQMQKLKQTQPKVVDAVPRWTREQIRMALEALKRLFEARSDPRQWAYSLRDKEWLGEPLSALQKVMWRSVIGEKK